MIPPGVVLVQAMGKVLPGRTPVSAPRGSVRPRPPAARRTLSEEGPSRVTADVSALRAVCLDHLEIGVHAGLVVAGEVAHNCVVARLEVNNHRAAGARREVHAGMVVFFRLVMS